MSATSLFEQFLEVATRWNDSPAISNENHEVTYGELRRHAEALIPLLAGEHEPRTVLLALPGGPQFTAVQLAGLAAGALVVPLTPDSTAHETSRCLELFEPHLAVVESPAGAPGIVEALPRNTTLLCLDHPEEHESDHPVFAWQQIQGGSPTPFLPATGASPPLPPEAALVQFTSGSSGRPKGIVLSQANLAAHVDHQREFIEPLAGRQVFCPVPQAHAYGGTVALEHLFHGVGVHLANRFLPAADVARISRHSCAGILAAPVYFRMLLQLGALGTETLPALSWITMGTASPGQELCRDVRTCRPDLTLYLRYGLTETMGPISRLELAPGEELPPPGLVGRVWPGIEVDFLRSPATESESKEIRVRGEIVAMGQLLERDQFRRLTGEDGFFATGDLGFVDDSGQLHLRGRISSFLKRNGFRINPFEIEDVLLAQEGVLEAAVVGVPDPVAGQKVVAIVERTPASTPPEPKSLLQACRVQLSPFKVPQECLVVDRLPRTRSGKPDRPKLVSLHGQRKL